MKITKFVHACLLVEMPAPVNRTALFDPGSMSADALDINKLQYLDDIIITHEHNDHAHPPLIRQLLGKFPDVRISCNEAVAAKLSVEGIPAQAATAAGVELFDAPHESMFPLGPETPVQNSGVHYLNTLTVPGDSHSFTESKPILALPVTGPWATSRKAAQLALDLRPRYILPVHDWHWHEDARQLMYDRFEALCSQNGMTFIKLQTGQPVVLDVG